MKKKRASELRQFNLSSACRGDHVRFLLPRVLESATQLGPCDGNRKRPGRRQVISLPPPSS